MIHLFLFVWLAGQAGTSDALEHVQAGLEARKQHQIEVHQNRLVRILDCGRRVEQFWIKVC